MRGFELEVNARLDRTIFRDYTCCGDPTLNQRVEAGQLPPPPGFQENTTAASIPIRVLVDTRPSGPYAPQRDPGGGRAGPGGGRDPRLRPLLAALRGHGPGLLGRHRDRPGARLGVWAGFVDPLGSQPVPFTNLVTLGGDDPFAGFVAGSLRDRSATAVQLSYMWPVFIYLDGVARRSRSATSSTPTCATSTSTCSGSRPSWASGTRGTGNSSFQFLVGIGTETFRQGFAVATFRFSFGVTYGL